MYEHYWHLESNPFSSDPNPAFFVRTDTHNATLLKLRYLIDHRKGAGLLLGDTGVGKSYLLSVLLAPLRESHGPLVRLAFPQMNPAETLAYIAVQLGADPHTLDSRLGAVDVIVREVEGLLASYAEQGRMPVIVVDEAHLIDDPQVLQTLRLLLNIHFENRPACTLILSGHRELLPRLRRMPQFDERIPVRCVLRALTQDETQDYIHARLQIAGGRSDLFDPDAMRAIFDFSGGVPRRINHLCDMALLVGYAEESSSINVEQVEAVAEESVAVVPD